MEKHKIRLANDNDVKKIRSLYEQFFTEDSKPYVNYYFSNIYSNKNTFILENEKKEMLCALQLRPKTLIFNNEKVKTNLIVAVMTPTKHQRKGYMALLMKHVLEKLDKKHEITLIQAYNWEVYRKFGFKDAYFQDVYKVKHSDLNKNNRVELVKKVNPNLLSNIYKSFTTNLNGYQLRSKKYYESLIETAKIEKLRWFASNNAYILVSKNSVVDMAFRTEEDLFDLIYTVKKDLTISMPSSFKAKKTLKLEKINSKLVMQWTGKSVNKYKKMSNLYINEYI